MNALDHRIKCGKARKRSGQWDREARLLAAKTGMEVQRILDVHEEQAMLLEWEGHSPADAEWTAWRTVVDILGRKRAA